MTPTRGKAALFRGCAVASKDKTKSKQKTSLDDCRSINLNLSNIGFLTLNTPFSALKFFKRALDRASRRRFALTRLASDKAGGKIIATESFTDFNGKFFWRELPKAEQGSMNDREAAGRPRVSPQAKSAPVTFVGA
jgi:hypothetical protein